jgi:hypothetical protein
MVNPLLAGRKENFLVSYPVTTAPMMNIFPATASH